MDDTTNESKVEDQNEENEFAEDFFDDNDPAFDNDDDDMDFNDDDEDFNDDGDFGDDGDDDDWGNLTYDPQAEILYRQTSQMDDNLTSKEKNTQKKPPSIFWKCIQCSFLNPPSNINCMACKQHKNPYNCLQYILSTNESTEENSNSDSSELKFLDADQSMQRTHLLIYGIIHENEPQFMTYDTDDNMIMDNISESLILKDIHVLILLYIPNYIAFGIGINTRGEMGLGPNHPNIQKYTKLDQMSLLMSTNPMNNFNIGHCRFFLRSINDELYVCGNNEMGTCGVGKNETAINNFTKINFDLETKNIEVKENDTNNNESISTRVYIKTISDGSYSSHSIIHCTDGSFYGIGKCEHAQFGNSEIPDGMSNVPLLLENLSVFFCKTNIVKIECGFKHTVFLTENCEVFACGDREHGQCGMADEQSAGLIVVPTKILDLPPIHDIHCGFTHNLCITRDDSKLYVFGDSRYGQLGMGESCILGKPTLHPFFADTEIVKIGCGLRGSYAIDIDDICHIFGRNDHLQIGANSLEQNIHTPHKFQSEGYENVVIEQLSLGAYHTVLLTVDNEMMAFGKNNCGQCSPKLYRDAIPRVSVPYVVERSEMGLAEDQYIARVVAGFNCTVIFVDIRCRNLKDVVRIFDGMEYDQVF